MKSIKHFFGSLFSDGPKPDEQGKQDGAEAVRKGVGEKRPVEAEDYAKTGDVIGDGTNHFEIRRKLGKGGFGVVYLAFHRETRELCALKTFRDKFLADASAKEAFRREALIWTKLGHHDCILEATAVRELCGRLFVVMNYVEPDDLGRVTLGDHLVVRRPIDANRAFEWAIDFCSGMEHAVAHGVKCHRDIKPDNILIAKGDRIQISDFGLAAAANKVAQIKSLTGCVLIADAKEKQFGLSLLQTGARQICGTPGYIPPEVYRGEAADIRSDIYSFGLVLWQMFAGSPTPPFASPYQGNMQAFLRAVYERQMTGCLPSVDQSVQRVIERCLQPQAQQRHETFTQLRTELMAVSAEQTGMVTLRCELVLHTGTYWVNRGASLAALKQHEDALGCYDRALGRLGDHQAEAWRAKGISLVALGRRKQALGCFVEALALDPRNVKAWYNRGFALAALGRREEALGCYDQLLAIDPRDAAAWYSKAALEEILSNKHAAAASWRKYLEMAAGDPLQREWIARAEERLQKLQ